VAFGGEEVEESLADIGNADGARRGLGHGGGSWKQVGEGTTARELLCPSKPAIIAPAFQGAAH